MKRLIMLIFIIINFIIFVGCEPLTTGVKNTQSKSLIEGQWRLKEVPIIDQSCEECESIDEALVSFSNNKVVLLGKVYKNISYKAKLVNKDKYLYEVIGFIPSNFKEENEDITVLTISSDNTFIKDIMCIEDKIYMLENSRLYELVKVNEEHLEEVDISLNNKDDDNYYKISSGVLLGLRGLDEDGYKYRTVWIKNEDGEINAQELPFLLVPRKSGFYKVSNKREVDSENYYKDTIVIEDMNGKVLNMQDDYDSHIEGVNFDKAITFISNDYMSTRTLKFSSDTNEESLSTYLLDLNTNQLNKPIPLNVLTGNKDISKFILSPNKSNIITKDNIDNFTNYAIRRKQGRWVFYTLNPNSKYDDMESKNKLMISEKNNSNLKQYNERVDITLRVPKKISRHDEIFIPWQGIQNHVPSATDAISSPNKNLAVIKTKSNLYIYKVVNNNLDKKSEIVFPLEGKENIVMVEWAEGDYVGYWSDQVKELNQH